MAQSSTRYDIVQGYSKYDQIISQYERKVVHLHLKGLGNPLPVIILSVQAEDGSGESWNIEGYVTDGPMKAKKFAGYYRTDRRTGFLNLID